MTALLRYFWHTNAAVFPALVARFVVRLEDTAVAVKPTVYNASVRSCVRVYFLLAHDGVVAMDDNMPAGRPRLRYCTLNRQPSTPLHSVQPKSTCCRDKIMVSMQLNLRRVVQCFHEWRWEVRAAAKVVAHGTIAIRHKQQ